jgi:hypothetical protein
MEPTTQFAEFISSEASRLGVSVATAAYHVQLHHALRSASADGRRELTKKERIDLNAAWAAMSPSEQGEYRRAL